TFPPAQLERVLTSSSVTLVPGEPTPVTTPVHELSGNAVTLTSARIQIWATPDIVFPGPTPPPDFEITVPVAQRIERRGAALLTVPVTLPVDLARTAPNGLLSLRITYFGTDETRFPIAVDAFSGQVGLLAATPSIAGTAAIRSVAL